MADDEDKTYTFDELSPEAQEKACDNNRYWNVDGYSWLETDYYETWLNELCEKRGVSFDVGGSMAIREEYNRWWVEIENEAGKVMELRLVGYDEIFGRKDYISIDSPMARALLGKEEDDEFVVKTETGTKEWWINRIWYDATDKL